MVDIANINGIAIAGISKINGIAKASIASINGYDIPSAGGGTIVTDPTLTNNLDHYWKFDTNANDSVGTYDWTVSGATLTTGSGGIIGECYDYDGVNDDLSNVSDWDTEVDGTQDFTVQQWIYMDALPASGVSMTTFRWGKGSLSFGFNLDKSDTYQDQFGVGCTFSGDVFKTHAFSSSLSTGTWYHMVVTYSTTSGFNLWVNGVDTSSSSTDTGTITSNTKANYWGSSNLKNYSNCKIDEGSMWQRVVTSAEIGRLYNSGAGIPYE